MNRIKSYLYTIFTAAAFIFGSSLCVRHRDCFCDPSQGSALLLAVGFSIILITFAIVNLLIKSVHPDSDFFQRSAVSACAFFLILLGTDLVVLKPYMHECAVFSAENIAFYFGVYLVIFGVSLIHFFIKH